MIRGPAVGERLEHYQIVCCRLANGRERNSSVERDKSPCMLNGKAKEVYVGKLPGAMDSRRIKNARIQQADFIRPEFMDVFATSVGKMFHDSMDRQCVRIARVRHNTDTPVLSNRTGRPTFPRVLRKPTHCDPVRRVIGVEQCYQYVNVQQRAH